MKRIFVIAIAFLSVTTLNAQWEKTSCPDENSIYYVTTKGDSVLTATGKGFFLSTDRGQTWSNILNGLPENLKCNAILTSGSNIYIGYEMGLYISTDNGASFLMCENTSGEHIYDIVKYGADIYLVSSTNYDGNGGILKSSDDCVSWTRITDGIDMYKPKVFAFRIIDNYLFAGTNGGVFRSSNNGLDWEEINNGLIWETYGVGYIYSLNEKIFTGTDKGLYVSLNNGLNWNLVGDGMPSDIGVTSMLTIDNSIFVGSTNGGGVYVSTDQGLSWIENSLGISGMEVFTLAKNDTHIYLGTKALVPLFTGGLFRQNLSWLEIDNYVKEKSVEIYPNPVSDILTIEIASASNVLFTIYDLNGQLIFERILNDKSTKIDVDKLPSGMYLTCITTGNSTEVNKFIKK